MADTEASLVVGGGCFWCTEAAYRLLPGVREVICGYAGGAAPAPTYESVCAGSTGHAEVVRVGFDPRRTTVEALLEAFWQMHDATQVGGQGADEGEQYRSIILYQDDAQRVAAVRSRDAAQARLPGPITTEIVPLDRFWPAEDRHQRFFERHPESGYCRVVIAPKLRRLRAVTTPRP